MTVLRRIGRGVAYLVATQSIGNALLLLYARYGRDGFYDTHWQFSTPVKLQRTEYVQFWRRSFYIPVLRSEERVCLELWLSMMELQTPPVGVREMSSKVITHDTLALFDGLSELRDGIHVLDHCLHRITPYVLEARRERQGRTTFLHCKVESEVEMRIPLTSYVFSLGRFPSTFTLELQPRREGFLAADTLVIEGVENHWFGGPVLSRLTGSSSSVMGDFGDLLRRYNAFLLATVLTKKDSLKESVADLRLRAAAMETELKLQQEEQLLL